MVVRAYAFKAFIPGIIVEGAEDRDDEDFFNPHYEQFNYIVLWSDGTQSTEMYEELDYLEDALQFEVDSESR